MTSRMMLPLADGSLMCATRRRRVAARRGVSSVLAMMFIVIFSSLTAVMAVVAQGNLRTADSALKLSRAMSAAETGLVFAARRLETQGRRFVIEKGVIDETYAEELWQGTYDEGADGTVNVLPPVGFVEGTEPAGLVHAVRNAHLADDHAVVVEEAIDNPLPEIDNASGDLRVRSIAITADADGNPDPDGPYFRLTYEIDEVPGPYVRVTSVGVDGDITRTLTMNFRITKKIEYAVVSPNRIMIGKNVRVEGPLGSRYGLEPGELNSGNGHPLVMRSDFYYLHDDLNDDLDVFFSELVEHDVDGDGRLRPDHTEEGLGLVGNPELVDYDGDEYVDDFDLFLAHYDADSDLMVVYDETLADAAGLVGLSNEFADIDDQLARLIDLAFPDRDGDGDPGTATDIKLGYRDGVLDINDFYAKVTGRLAFAVAREDWEAAQDADYQNFVHGPVRAGIDQAPVTFEVTEDEMSEVTTDMFSDAETWFDAQAAEGSFVAQLGAQSVPHPSGMWEVESVPYGDPAPAGAYDYYQRPVYENLTFQNVRIPMGENALFRNCTFVGVTFIETYTECTHDNWNLAGQQQADLSIGQYGENEAELADGTVVANTKPYSNSIRFDACTFLGSVTGDKPEEYTHWRNKVQFTGNTRFYIDPSDPDLLAEIAEGTAGAQDWQDVLNAIPADDREELEKSSILLPGWSADVGNFNNEQEANPEDTPKVKLKGTIVAGILDVRGTADVHGTLLMTFRPVPFEGPLAYGSLPDTFNTTIGYFGPADGDGEGTDPTSGAFEGFGEIALRYNPDAKLPDGIPWPITLESAPLTYQEGGS